ncbi:ketosynthase chain-length factor [Amycolatopsis acidicola]|uniref:Ketosynthase chain-length factor n=1 Tax=Amycolatopsis acidicola TaxID=2596893 RepID=A0A5N0VPG7_9PSEU|nr:beta-ketoacyl synthase N-terminal-like domain-containing protein [Amycolatopsis acidicola]KAA9166511.1 ketosynthase chain-length factor [Amycolatopsis acidicola]
MTAAVVTGLGVIAPTGLGTDAFWSATRAGELGIRPAARFDATGWPVTLAGEAPAFDPADHLPGRLIAQTDRMTQFALAAADWAVAEAGLAPADLAGAAISTAAAFGGFEYGQRQLQELWSHGPKYVSTYMSFAWFYAVNAGQISIRHATRGPAGVFVGEQAGGLDAIGNALRQVRSGANVVLTGGMESSRSPYGHASHLANRDVSREPRPERAFLPFSTDACGYVPGEGGAILVVQPESAARGKPYGRITGHGAAFDGRPGAPGAGLRRAAAQALADAGLSPGDIDAVFADAGGTPALDLAEASAITGLFGPRGVPVAAPKAGIGRLASGGAPVDVVTALLAFRDGVLPPAGAVAEADPAYELDLVTTRARPWEGRRALVLARGARGFHSALVLTAPDAD